MKDRNGNEIKTGDYVVRQGRTLPFRVVIANGLATLQGLSCWDHQLGRWRETSFTSDQFADSYWTKCDPPKAD